MVFSLFFTSGRGSFGYGVLGFLQTYSLKRRVATDLFPENRCLLGQFVGIMGGSLDYRVVTSCPAFRLSRKNREGVQHIGEAMSEALRLHDEGVSPGNDATVGRRNDVDPLQLI